MAKKPEKNENRDRVENAKSKIRTVAEHYQKTKGNTVAVPKQRGEGTDDKTLVRGHLDLIIAALKREANGEPALPPLPAKPAKKDDKATKDAFNEALTLHRNSKEALRTFLASGCSKDSLPSIPMGRTGSLDQSTGDIDVDALLDEIETELE
jgi:hypothetical protein